MNAVDLAVLAVLALHAVLGVARGFARQSLKLAGGVAAIWAALAFYDRIGAFLKESFDLAAWGETSTAALGFLVVGLGVYLASHVVAHLARAGIEKARLGGADRFLGLIFGAVKGALWCAIALHFVDPVAPHLPESVRAQFYGAPAGEPAASRAYALYRDHVKARADELQRDAVERARPPEGR